MAIFFRLKIFLSLTPQNLGLLGIKLGHICMNEPKLDDLTGVKAAKLHSRRQFLKTLTYGSIALGSLPSLSHAAFTSFSSFKKIDLEHHHTGETLSVTYYENGSYQQDALESVNYLLRDYHNDLVHPIDPALLDYLHDVKLLLGVNRPFHIVSGYRSPATNSSLRRHSRGVAKHSLHMEGRAVDIRIEGVSVKTIRTAALSLERGGVGFYPRSNFIHLDTGDLRTWRR
jgi:uncharacterized protein YcbK (DUF882 family)